MSHPVVRSIVVARRNYHMEIIETEAKEIFTKTRLPGADWVLNPYVGCGHACAYCYAKFMSRWKRHGEWGTWVEAKMNAPELVKGKYVEGIVFMSSVSDAYQPVEEELRLTRRIMENMDRRTRLSILTKSDLVVRDLDLLLEFEDVEVGFTVNSFGEEVKKLLEPESVSVAQRIEAMKKFHEMDIRTYAFVGPIIPGLTNVSEIITSTKDFADHYWFELLNLRGAGKGFVELLEKEYPESHAILTDESSLSEFVRETEKIVKDSGVVSMGVLRH